MKRLLVAVIWCVFAVAAAHAQQPAGLWLDASQFGKTDICLGIQAAIAALPTTPIPGGAVIDARNFVPSGPTTPFVKCTANPFTVGTNTNPLVLANGGIGANCTTVPTPPGCLGGVLLLPGLTISTDVPWIVPGNWSIIGQGGKISVLAPSTSFNTNLTSYVTGTVSGVSTNTLVNGAGTPPPVWSSNMVGMIFTACATNGICNATATSYSSATVVGIVTNVVTTTQLSLGTALQSTLTSPSYYTLQAPVMAWATTMPCTPVASCSGALQANTSGSVIQDIGLSCIPNAVPTGTPVSGCIPFWDQYGQERSQLKRLLISGFLGLGVGIYTSNAQNGGPFEDLDLESGPTAIVAGTTCVEVGGTGVGVQPSMRGIRGITCTNHTKASGTDGIGIDINTQNFSLSDAHFEDYSLGVEVGDLTSARGIWLSNITGGNSLGTVVDINAHCATSSGTNCLAATADINVQSVYKSTSTTTFKDNINGNTATEVALGLYSLGDGTTTGGVSNRPVVTTSSSIGSSPNLIGMTAATPVTGVQGTTGTLVQMSTGTVASGDLGSFDSNGNLIDSGVASFVIATSGQGGIWLPTTFWPSPNVTAAQVSAVMNQVKVIQFVLPTKITFTRLTAQSVANDSSNSFNLGIYDASGHKLADSTSLTCATNTVQTGTITAVTLQPGVYYFAYAATDTACTIVSLTSVNSISNIFNKNFVRQGTAAMPLASGLLPGTLGTISSAIFGPAVAFIEP